jgi:hypothetical protein
LAIKTKDSRPQELEEERVFPKKGIRADDQQVAKLLAFWK